MFATAALLGCVANDGQGPLRLAAMGSFFVGGEQVEHPGFPPNGDLVTRTVVVDQSYVSYHIPYRQRGAPVVLLHGCCQTGAAFETTPDGRTG